MCSPGKRQSLNTYSMMSLDISMLMFYSYIGFQSALFQSKVQRIKCSRIWVIKFLTNKAWLRYLNFIVRLYSPTSIVRQYNYNSFKAFFHKQFTNLKLLIWCSGCWNNCIKNLWCSRRMYKKNFSGSSCCCCKK